MLTCFLQKPGLAFADVLSDERIQQAFDEENVAFPIVWMVVLLSLATAMVCGMALGPYSGKETGETALLRELFKRLVAGDIILGDRYYCSYFLIVLLLELGVDVVTTSSRR